jgi:aryl-alcohol dehydrogenase-like predicted oxidoreductase
MQLRRLGRTDLKVSELSLGTMTWGSQNTQSDAFAQMDFAFESGINFFDTAELYPVPPSADTYGATEIMIGNWLQERGLRDQIILASKVAGPALPWIREGQARLNRPHIIAALEASLKRLKTSYIDLYQLHWPNRSTYHFGQLWNYNPAGVDSGIEEEGFLEVLETLHDLIRLGKIRHIGLSNETAWGVMKYLEISEDKNLPRVVSIQNEYSLTCRLFEPDLAEIALHEDVGLLAYSPLSTGAISGKYLNGQMPAGSRRTLPQRNMHRANPMTDMAIAGYMNVAKTHHLDVCQMALAFVLSRPFVTSAIIGATNLDQLKSNLGSVDVRLTAEAIRDIEAVRRQYPVPY